VEFVEGVLEASLDPEALNAGFFEVKARKSGCFGSEQVSFV
jgi:hypothetical protein